MTGIFPAVHGKLLNLRQPILEYFCPFQQGQYRTRNKETPRQTVMNISITYYMEHEMDRKIIYSSPELVRNDLDNVVEKLELYKTRKGGFPESLQQLQKEFPTINIGDTLIWSTISKVKFGYYYYQRKGGKFILFSTGWDRIPFTEDDIYPHDALKRDPNIIFSK